jgi:hypothetical protein
VALDRDSVALAVVSRRWKDPRMLPGARDDTAALADADGILRLHFDYCRQDDSYVVYSELCEAQRLGQS